MPLDVLRREERFEDHVGDVTSGRGSVKTSAEKDQVVISVTDTQGEYPTFADAATLASTTSIERA